MGDVPYLRWQLGDHRPWHSAKATVAAVDRGHRIGLVAVGDPADHDDLIAEAISDLRTEGHRTFRISVDPRAVATLSIRRPQPSYWEWMLNRTGSPKAPRHRVDWLEDADREIASLLGQHNPTHHAKPGDPSILGWAGIREGGLLVAAGALTRNDAGVPHLRSIAVRGNNRRRGLGRSVSTFLTDAGFVHSEAVTLSLYSDNHAARSMYHALGYRTEQKFASFNVAFD